MCLCVCGSKLYIHEASTMGQQARPRAFTTERQVNVAVYCTTTVLYENVGVPVCHLALAYRQRAHSMFGVMRFIGPMGTYTTA